MGKKQNQYNKAYYVAHATKRFIGKMIKYVLGDNVPNREFYENESWGIISSITGGIVTIKNKSKVMFSGTKEELMQKHNIEIDS